MRLKGTVWLGTKSTAGSIGEVGSLPRWLADRAGGRRPQSVTGSVTGALILPCHVFHTGGWIFPCHSYPLEDSRSISGPEMQLAALAQIGKTILPFR